VTAVDGGFRVSFADADPITARQVVVATGVLPYYRIPDELAGLPADLLSHTKDIHRLEPFQGRRVAVIGAGQSALETAALLHEAGADTRLVVRKPALNFVEPNPETLSWFGHLIRPTNKLCEGWRCAVWFSPEAFRLLPESVRVTKARTVLGPGGSWWLKNRIEGGPARPGRHAEQVPGAVPGRPDQRARSVLRGRARRGQPGPVRAVHRRHPQQRAPADPVAGGPGHRPPPGPGRARDRGQPHPGLTGPRRGRAPGTPVPRGSGPSGRGHATGQPFPTGA
jgi:hypothetical protein